METLQAEYSLPDLRMNLTYLSHLQRYNPGGKFGAHYDGSYVEDEDERSLLTFMIYLNVGYKGGRNVIVI